MRLKQFAMEEKLESALAPVKNGQRQAWIPDGGECVITILWCKMRHWWNEILFQIFSFVYLAEGSAVIL